MAPNHTGEVSDEPLGLNKNLFGPGPQGRVTTYHFRLTQSTIAAIYSFREVGAGGGGLDARYITYMFVICTDADFTTSALDLIPEVIRCSGIREFPFKRIYYTLIDCFNFSSSRPIAILRLRDLSYPMARALVHIQPERCCLTQYEEREQESQKAIDSNHTGLGPGLRR